MKKNSYLFKSIEETSSFAVKLAKQIHNGGALFLFGDLGSGKTTFTQEFAKELGIKRHVISPTFLIMRTYDISHSEGKLYHVDLYRIGSEREIEEVGVLDAMKNPQNIVIIEWAEKMQSLLPKKRKELHFAFVDENTRSVEEIEYE